MIFRLFHFLSMSLPFYGTDLLYKSNPVKPNQFTMISHCISSLGGIIFVLVLSHFTFSNFKGHTYDFVKGLVLNF